MKEKIPPLVSNKKAYHDFEILETFEAGIVLKGSEIKSLRNHTASLQDSFIIVKKNELWLINSYIAPYKFSSHYQHKERRDRKLLMHKKEISKLKKISHEKSLSIIPLSFYLKSGVVKVKVAIAKGKKKGDKRAQLKEIEHKKIMEKFLKS
jgi:SsrA-binding protein